MWAASSAGVTVTCASFDGSSVTLSHGAKGFAEFVNVRYWHLADIPSCTANVRFWG